MRERGENFFLNHRLIYTRFLVCFLAQCYLDTWSGRIISGKHMANKYIINASDLTSVIQEVYTVSILHGGTTIGMYPPSK